MNIALCGLGKAGKKFIEHTLESLSYNLSAVLCRDESNTAGMTVEQVTNIHTQHIIEIQRISDFTNVEKVDVIIDFSNSRTTFELLDVCCKYGINLVICPTDFTECELDIIKKKTLNCNIGVVYAPTLTIGINMLIDFVKKLSYLFEDFEFEIIEKHSKMKGSPTKTAQIIAENIDKKNTHISSVRLDGYVGVHEVIATNGIEKIVISHESFSREAFANGALIAADYIVERTGFYEMKDIIEDLIKKHYINSIIE